jgi:hypothetical protein
MSALKWCLSGLASMVLGCASPQVTPHLPSDGAQPASQTAGSQQLLPFGRTQTRGQIRVTLASIGRTTRFVHQSAVDDDPPHPGAVPDGAGAGRAVPCVELEFVVEYLADVPSERRIHGSQSVIVNGGAIDGSNVAAKWPRQSGVIVEMLHFYAGTAGFPRIERPDRAVYRRLIIWGVSNVPRYPTRVDVAIEEGADDRVESFRFENVPLPQ